MNSLLIKQYRLKMRAAIVLFVLALVMAAVTLFLSPSQKHDGEQTIIGVGSVDCALEVSTECPQQLEPLESASKPEPGPIHTTKLDSFEL